MQLEAMLLTIGFLLSLLLLVLLIVLVSQGKEYKITKRVKDDISKIKKQISDK